MPRSLHLFAVCALALVVGSCVPGYGQDASAPAPSLGDAARQAQAQAQKDKDKDKGKPAAKKVFTNDDLSSGSASLSTSSGPGTVAQPGAQANAQPGAAGKPGASAAASPSPADQLAQVAALLNELGSLDRATLAKNVLQGNDADFPDRDKWEDTLFEAKQAFVAQERAIMNAADKLEASSKAGTGIPNSNDPRAQSLNNDLQQLTQEAQQSSAAFQAVVAEFKKAASQSSSH
jgi:hypothetical protein